MKKFKKKRGFHKKRGFRLSDETFLLLKQFKKGTWNYFLTGVIKIYEAKKGKAQ